MNSFAANVRFGRFELRLSQRQLLADGQPVNVGARAFDLLQVLVEKRDRVVGHDELLELVWPGLIVEENNLRQHVSALRKLLGATAVVTVPGRGYRFGLLLEDTEAVACTRAALDESAFVEETDAGSQMTREEAIEFALGR